MTDHQLLSETRDCGADAAAYVLGALEREEAEAFRAHLTSCVVCRDEVSAFQEVADALPLVARAQPVPHRLRRRLMASVRAEPRGSRATRRRLLRLPPGPFTAMSSPALTLSAVVAALVVAIGAVTLFSGASETRLYSANVSWHGNAQLRVTGGRGELVVRGMPAPPANKIYEVWLLKRGNRAPSPTSALFSVTSTGSGSVDVPGSLRGVSAVLVTPEPAGGSALPTHAPVLEARLG
jgi:anti-sigma-K factor RskA